MADKSIGELPQAQKVLPESLIPLEQDGQAMRMSGEQFADFAKESVSLLTQQAADSANTATEAANTAKAARERVSQSEQNVNQAAQASADSAALAGEEADRAKTEADRAEQAAAGNGWAEFRVVNGRVIYAKTDNVAVDFTLVDGRLIQVCQ